MAAVASHNILRISRQQACTTLSAYQHVQRRAQHGAVVRDQHTNLTAYRRGRGGRSSFSGIVATVFGASGFVGKGVVLRLGKIGSQVIVPYRDDYYNYRECRLAGDLGQILFLPFHLKDEEAIRKAVKYSNVVVNCLGSPHQTRNFKFDQLFYEGAARIARVSREVGVERLIHISDINASLEPAGHVIRGGSRYLIAKQKGENAVRDEFPGATIFRPTTIFGEQDHFLWMMKDSRRRTSWFEKHYPLYMKGKSTTKAPVFRSDLLTGITNAIQDDRTAGQVYEAYGPKEYYQYDMIRFLLNTLRNYDKKIVGCMSDPYFMTKLYMKQLFIKMFNVKPRFTLDMLERDAVSDNIHLDAPNLEDLGVTLTPLEFMAHNSLKMWRRNAYQEDIQMETQVEPPPPIRRLLARNEIHEIEDPNPNAPKRVYTHRETVSV